VLGVAGRGQTSVAVEAIDRLKLMELTDVAVILSVFADSIVFEDSGFFCH
jgi:hypothetical protein